MKPKKQIQKELYNKLLEKINHLLEKGFTNKEIAEVIGTDISVISRIKKKNILSIKKLEEYLEKINNL